ncbi:glutathione S-transferase theta-1-like [Chrysoperla carnea]|uniref:glutathione S-transferase theta-1-like n=1 Tax=Chrysoperla carnea TaxID=189513 RepID=UPI001D07E0E6|nr:glutathione S-transferase theta-1-like [Chrysoperla carnea]
MTLKVYYDLLSQPSRALLMFLQVSKVPFEHRPIALAAGEHLSSEFKAISRFQKLPVIDDNGFKLSESIAIVRYLVREKLIPDHWYSRNSQQQARIDEYLEWQHLNTRFHCASYFTVKFRKPLVTGAPPSQATINSYEMKLNKCLNGIENLWLRDNKYLVGNKITVADLFGANEIEQTRIAGFDPREGRPILSAWLERVRNDVNPYYDEVLSTLNELAGNKEDLKASAKI